jgi:hypothetical protein
MKNIYQETVQPFGIRNDYPPNTQVKVKSGTPYETFVAIQGNSKLVH